ncbi:transmembrane and death domain protein 1 [Oenanthe melanoleuca]|uniref:transmembrane and death domain protein 1 n=1 Tax=Oenanthe melanoleuca TaxID=2939378 RepID=UPI0024C103FF|nr:transmembrane and death domain protein 1 [Oenanthe melanoleuca]
MLGPEPGWHPTRAGSRAVLAPLSLALLLLALRGHCDDTVAASVGRHTMGRIAELLGSSECRQLQAELESPEEELELPEPPQPEGIVPGRRRRDSRGQRGCSEALRFWLVTAGEVTTWDRLVRALRHIGRSDIAGELGKNLNQDRSLELRRNVERYGSSVQHLSSRQLQPAGPRARRAPLPGEMLFERHPPSQYSRGLLGWLRPVALGVLGAFLTSVLLTGTLMYWCHWRRLLGA